MSTMPITESNARGERSSVRAMKFPAALLTSTSSGVDHRLDGVEIADVAWKGLNCASGGGGEFGCGLFEDGFAAAADADSCTEFEEALSHAFAEARASSGDEDAFAVEKIFLEHECSVRVPLANKRCRDCSDDFKLPLELRSILYECLPQRLKPPPSGENYRHD